MSDQTKVGLSRPVSAWPVSSARFVGRAFAHVDPAAPSPNFGVPDVAL